MRLLLIEDDAMIGESICRALRQEGFSIDWLQGGESAVSALARKTEDSEHDVVLLDLGLPRRPGLDVPAVSRRASCRPARPTGRTVPL